LALGPVFWQDRGQMVLLLRWYATGLVAGVAAFTGMLWAPAARAEQVALPKVEAASAAPNFAERAGPWVVVTGGAMLLAGIGTGFAERAREEDARSSCRRGSGAQPECPERTRADFDAARSLATATNVLLIGGGILSLSGIGLCIVGAQSRDPARSAKVKLTPEFSRSGPSFSLTGVF
jgi:hypothetical protein